MTAPADTNGSVSAGTCCHDFWSGNFSYRPVRRETKMVINPRHYNVTCAKCGINVRVIAWKGKTRWGFRLKYD